MYIEFKNRHSRSPNNSLHAARSKHSRHAAPISLQEIPLFQGLREDTLRAIAAKAVEKIFPKNAIVVSEGEFTGSLYLLLAGTVKVYLAGECGKEIILDLKG